MTQHDNTTDTFDFDSYLEGLLRSENESLPTRTAAQIRRRRERSLLRWWDKASENGSLSEELASFISNELDLLAGDAPCLTKWFERLDVGALEIGVIDPLARLSHEYRRPLVDMDEDSLTWGDLLSPEASEDVDSLDDIGCLDGQFDGSLLAEDAAPSFDPTWDGVYQESLESADPKLARRSILTEEQQLAGEKASITWEPNWIHLNMVDSLRNDLRDELLTEVSKAKSLSTLRSISGRASFLSVVAQQANKGHTKLPQGQKLPKGREHFGIDYRRFAVVVNECAKKAYSLISQPSWPAWVKLESKLTYVMGDEDAKVKAEAEAKKLQAWFNTDHGITWVKIKAIGVEKAKAPTDGDILDHCAQQGEYLALESEEALVCCPVCSGTGWVESGICPICEGWGEATRAVLNTNLIGVQSVGSFSPSEDQRCDVQAFRSDVGDVIAWQNRCRTLSDFPSVEVTEESDPRIPITVVKPGVVRRNRGALSLLSPAPRLIGWTSMEELVSSCMDLSSYVETSDPTPFNTPVIRIS